ncbi:MAG: UvrD-helicase domain-containing protein [Candidatus Borkfalkiaceae bacterium]|nr:UvrD-helicase domain-containing protein [Christensenellaceae bacterium]
MADNEKNYTPDQRKAVIAEGRNVLVSASAGSGKTFVMIERVIRLIVEGKAEVGEILAVTYTTAAAEEMKQKLVKAIIAEINAGRDAARFRKALSEVPTASISTFHSFCANLIRTYFYALDVDPSVSVADENQAGELKNKALDSLFESLYETRDEDFLYLVRIMGRSRGDDSLKETVKKLYEFASSEKSAEEFLTKAAENITEKSFYKSENELYGIFAAYIKELIRIGENLTSLAESYGYAVYVEYVGELLVKLKTCLNAKDFRSLIKAAGLSVPKAPRTTSKDDEDLAAYKGKLEYFKKKCKDVYDDIREASPNDDEEKDLSEYLSTARATKALCRLTIDFGKEYARLKADAAALDFSDLEHFAYKLLSENSDVLSAVKRKYKYVFADEYQDVNGIQEAILSLISSDNAFMVGDVKQSIYAFRGCNPDIIAAKFERYERGEGETVSLDANFRSTDAVLAAVNKTFSPIMTKDFGGTDYKNNPMTGSGKYPQGYGETILIEIPEAEKEKTIKGGVYDIVDDVNAPAPKAAFAEGAVVANIVRKEAGGKVYDLKAKREREVTPKDFAVLTRNSSGFPTEIVRHLKRNDIPVSSSAKNPVGDYPEIKLLKDLLKIIVRFADDAPLFACLKSAIGGVSEAEAAEIKRAAYAAITSDTGDKPAATKKPTFADCYRWYLLSGEDENIRNKLKNFDEYISKIRLLSGFENAGEILSRVLSETGLDLEILSQKNGEIRLSRVERFIAEAGSGENGLSVSKFLTRAESDDGDVSVGSSDGDDSVTVTSMHASKGLEYPIVILAGLGKRFNLDDTKKEILTDRYEGIALKFYDEESKRTKITLPRAAFKERARLNAIKEEMRVFYVAMTRAECKLYLVTSEPVEENDDFTSILFANKFSDFIKTKYFDKKITADDTEIGDGEDVREVYISKDRPALTDLIRKNLSFIYPYEEDVNLPVKRAVTSLAEDATTDDDEMTEIRLPVDKTTRERGIAYHAFLQHADSFYEDAGVLLEKIKTGKKLTDEQLALLSEEKLRKILRAPLFEEIRGYKFYKEQPFIAQMAANEISNTNATGDVLVQGIIDLLAVKGDKAIIVDYKYSKKSISHLKETYAYQLALYKKAVEKTLKLKVEKTILFNLNTVESIPCE